MLYQGSFLELTDSVAAAVAIVDVNGDQLGGFDASRPSTATLASVAASITSVVLRAANAARRQIIIVNNGTKNLFIAFAATATTSAFTLSLGANGVYESPVNGYTGVISGIWSAANGSALITEITT